MHVKTYNRNLVLQFIHFLILNSSFVHLKVNVFPTINCLHVMHLLSPHFDTIPSSFSANLDLVSICFKFSGCLVL